MKYHFRGYIALGTRGLCCFLCTYVWFIVEHVQRAAQDGKNFAQDADIGHLCFCLDQSVALHSPWHRIRALFWAFYQCNQSSRLCEALSLKSCQSPPHWPSPAIHSHHPESWHSSLSCTIAIHIPSICNMILHAAHCKPTHRGKQHGHIS